MLNNSTFFVVLDLGDKHSYVAVLDPGGELIEESRLPSTKASFQRKFSALQPCRVAMEVGTSLALGKPTAQTAGARRTGRQCTQAQSDLSQPP